MKFRWIFFCALLLLAGCAPAAQTDPAAAETEGTAAVSTAPFAEESTVTEDATEASITVPTATEIPFPQTTITISTATDFRLARQWEIQKIVKITGLALSPNLQNVAVFTQQYPDQWRLELREAGDGTLLWEVEIGKAPYNALAFSPDGTLVATGTDEGFVRLWDSENGQLVNLLSGHVYPVRTVAFSPDGALLASGGSDSTARVWEVSSGESLRVYDTNTSIRDLAWSPDGEQLAVAARYIHVYKVFSDDLQPGVYYDVEGDTRDLGEAAFSPDASILIGAGEWLNIQNRRWRNRILVWDYPGNRSEPIRIPLNDAVEGIVVSPDGRYLVCAYQGEGTLLLIDIADREIKGEIDIGAKLYIAYAPDLSAFAAASTRNSVSIWEIIR
ncbi:MAG: hypothetical protein JXA13_14430 [Anaerolineales bacterium]|nr:hypothetical protein [Anaerolineales bacterium]